MKSWLKSKRSSRNILSTKNSSSRLPNAAIDEPPAAMHTWKTLHDTGSQMSISALELDSTNTTPPVLETSELEIAPEVDLLKSYSRVIAESHEGRSLVRQNILVASEHFFRLVLESYEQLKAVHYRASQEFSLAEWLHIHALLLYGRIQHIHKVIGGSGMRQNYSELNRIDISGDIPVFVPIATALNAIGVVEDEESGIAYVPDAFLPSKSYKPGALKAEYSLQEMHQILSGTLYDWHRSWHRVLEARNERNLRSYKYCMIRSSSELISAISETTESLSRIRKSPNLTHLAPTRETAAESELSSESGATTNQSEISEYENKLTLLFEEARNAKDYTIHPPCGRIYNPYRDQFTKEQKNKSNFVVLNELSKSNDTTAHDSSQNSSMAILPSLSTNSPVTPECRLSIATSESFTQGEAKAVCVKEVSDVHSIYPFNDSQLPTTSTESLESGIENYYKSGGMVSPDTSVESVEKKLNDLTIPSEEPTGAITEEFFAAPDSEGHRNTVEPLCPAQPKQGIEQQATSAPLRSALHKPAPIRIVKTKPFTPIVSPIVSPLNSKPRVQIGGSNESLDSFVQYDSQLWKGYSRFVASFVESKLAQFGPMTSETTGNYSWLISVKMNHTTPDAKPLIRLPRKSIPAQDQVLAMILQTSHADINLTRSWHIHTVADIDVPKLMTEYVKTAVYDRLL